MKDEILKYRKRIEELEKENSFLKENSELFKNTNLNQKIISNANYGIIVYDTELRYQVWNPFMEKISGIKAKEIIGKKPSDFFPFLVENKVIDKLYNLLKSGKSFHTEFPFTINNKQGWTSDFSSAIKDENNKITGVIGIVTDITENKQIENELKKEKEIAEKNEEHLRLINNATFDQIYSYDLENRFTSANKTLCENLKLSADEIIGKSYWELGFPEENCKAWDELHKQVYSEVQKKEVVSTPMPDGTTQYFEVNLFVLKDKDGKAVGISGVNRNITESKIAEQEIIKAKNRAEESEITFRKLFEESSDAILLIDDKGVFVECNQATLNLLKMTREQVLSQAPSKISPDFQPNGRSSEEAAAEMIHLAYQKGLHRFDWTHINAEGGEFIVEISLVPIVIKGQQMLHTRWRDITERKRAEEKIRIAEENLKNTFNLSPSIISKANLKTGYFVEANQAVTRILGYTIEEFRSKPISEFIHPDDRQNTNDELDAQIKGREAISFENRYLCKDGSYKWIAWHGTKANKEGIVTAIGSDITMRKKAELELIKAKEIAEKNEQKLIDAQTVAKLGSWETNLITMDVVWSDETYKIFGLDKEQFKNTHVSFLEYVHPDDIERIEDVFAKSFSSKDYNSVQHRIITPSGKLKHVEERWITYHDSKNKPIVSFGTCQDITENIIIQTQLKEAKEKAEESERKLIEAQELSHVGNWEYIIDADTVTWSKELYNIFERSYDLPAPQYSEQHSYYTKESFDLLDKAVQDCVQHETPYEIELDIITSSGTVKQIISKGRVKKDKDNKVIGSYGTAQDITQKKKIEQDLIKAKEKAEENEVRLQQKNEEYETINEELIEVNEELIKAKEKAEESEIQLKYSQRVASIGYYIFNIQSGLWSSSEMLDEIFGIEENYIKDMNGWLNLIHPDFRQEMLNYLSVNILENHETFNKSYKIINKKTNTPCWVHGLGTLEFDNNSNLIKMFGTIQDISKSKKFEQELIIAKEKAEESDHLKTEFIHNLSHEIRTPMNGILGFSNILDKENLTSEKRKHYVRIIQNSGNQLMRIIDDILEISKLGTKQVVAFESQICLNDLLLEMFSIFDIKAKENRTPLYIKKGLSDQESTIFTDESKLNKILSNLLENALKFTNEGFIEFGYNLKKNRKKSELEIYVKDTGIGICTDKQELVFERFSQEEKGLSKNFGGLGLGLSIAKENAELLGGKISLKSEKAKGSVFYITIPYKPAKAEIKKAKSKNKAGKLEKESKHTVLIVEDEEVNFLFIETLLEEEFDMNFNILHAKNGKEALDMCKENTEINFVLMDMKMPVMNGFEATKQIKEFRPDLPIVAQTAYTSKEDKNKAINAGCDDFISKPINEEELKQIILSFLK